MANVDDVDADFAKVAARGITIVFASGDSGAGYQPPHAQCSPPPSAQHNTGLVGTPAMTESVENMEECCFMASEGSGTRKPSEGWMFEPGKADTCADQTPLPNLAFDGFVSGQVHAASSLECCNKAAQEQRNMWTYNSEAGMCSFFEEVRGRHVYPHSSSGMGRYAGMGKCTTFTVVTGTEPKPLVVSQAGAQKTHIKLYPSWPASSPWVTSVGSTRFVDQQVGQPEMATDQFGSGGGFSDMFDAMDSQKDAVTHYFSVAPQLPPDGSFPRSGRGTPDVAALGEGFQVIIRGRNSSVGGTSASAPTFAGILSLLNEARLAKGKPPMGYVNPWLYKNAAAFTDITRGDNLRGRGPFVEPYGFNCTEGWDPVTGLGTPLFDKMLAAAVSTSGEVVV